MISHCNFRFGTGSHGDPFPFDGEGGTLAHAFYPIDSQSSEIAGDVHFDEAELYASRMSQKGKDLLWVATHEIGKFLL